MKNWFDYFKRGMSRELPSDQLAGTNKPQAPKEALNQLLPYLRAHWKAGVIGATLIVFTSLLAFPQPLITRFLVDDVILDQQLDLLPWAILLLVGFKIISMGAGVLQGYYLLIFEQSIILDIQKALLDHTLRLPKAFFDKKEVGYIMTRISSDVNGLRWFFSGTIVYLFTNLLRFIGGLVFLFYLEWRLALVSVIALPGLLLSVRYFSKRMRILSHQGMETRATITQRLQEVITSLPLIKSFSTEGREKDRVMSAFEDQRQVTIEQNVVNTVTNNIINLAPDLARGIVLVIGAYFVITGEWTLGSLYAFQSYLSYVFGPAMYFANANLSLQNSLASLERVMSLFNVVPEENLETGLVVDEIKGEIGFKDVSFSYGGDEPVLKDISFTINPGEKIAIVGPSGVGKTTLISLLLCFYQPTEGRILFDGTSLSDYHLPSIRKRIGYVSQSTLLLSGTIAENLRYGHPAASQNELEAACKVAGIHDFITRLPNGYQSRVDERGVNLSEGQKQRLSIARALIKNPDILILDEPTSALDSIVERSIFDALPPFIQDKTLFIVAHRLSTIQNSDRIVLLNEKQLVGIGTHQQLLAESPFYRELVANQIVSTASDSN